MPYIIYVGHRLRHRGEYVGRPTVLGNPFSSRGNTLALYAVATAEEAVAKYATWLDMLPRDSAPWNHLRSLAMRLRIDGQITLLCWCASDLIEYEPGIRLCCHAVPIAACVKQLAEHHTEIGR
mgnify:CR=1 FL=1